MPTLRELELTTGQEIGECLDGATLTFYGREPIPCTHSPILKDFDLVPGGKSPKTTIQSLQFRVSLCGELVPQKGVKCKLTSAGKEYGLQLWAGGPLSGGAVYQFMAVDENYKA